MCSKAKICSHMNCIWLAISENILQKRARRKRRTGARKVHNSKRVSTAVLKGIQARFVRHKLCGARRTHQFIGIDVKREDNAVLSVLFCLVARLRNQLAMACVKAVKNATHNNSVPARRHVRCRKTKSYRIRIVRHTKPSTKRTGCARRARRAKASLHRSHAHIRTIHAKCKC